LANHYKEVYFYYVCMGLIFSILWFIKCLKINFLKGFFQNFPGGACPQTPLEGEHALHALSALRALYMPPTSTLDRVPSLPDQYFFASPSPDITYKN